MGAAWARWAHGTDAAFGRACEWGPSEYESEGPHLAAPHQRHRLPGWRVRYGRPPIWKQQLKSRSPGFPVTRVSPASREFPPGRTSALAVNEFVLRSGELAQGFLARNFKILLDLREIHRKARVIPRERRLSTALSTVWSTVWSTGWPTVWPTVWSVRTDDWDYPAGPVTPSPLRSPSGGPGLARQTREMSGNAALHKRGPSMYEMEGPRRGHLAGPPITRLPGCYPAAPPGREISPEGQFPGFPCARPDVPVSRSDGVRGPS